MDKETLEQMSQLSNKKIDLKSYMQDCLTPIKVKVISCNANNSTGKEAVEKTLNEFISDKELIDIKFNVNRNFLPGTQLGEYEEIWYIIVLYKERK